MTEHDAVRELQQLREQVRQIGRRILELQMWIIFDRRRRGVKL